MDLTREQTQKIIDNGKAQGLETKVILDGLVKRGYNIEGVDTAAATKAIVREEAPADMPVEEPGFIERLGTKIENKGAKVADAIAGEGEFAGKGSVERGVAATATAFSGISSTIYEALPKGTRDLLDKAAGGVGKGFTYLTDKLSETPLFKDIGELEAQGFINKETAPELYKTESALNVAAGTGQIAGEILLADQTAKLAQTATNVAKKTATTVAEAPGKIADKITKTIDEIKPVRAPGEAIAPNASANIMQRVARISKGKQAKFERMTGESVGDYLAKRNIYGEPEKVVEQLFKNFEKSKGLVDETFSTIKGTSRPAPVKTALQDLLERETRISTPGAPSPDLNAVTKLMDKFNKTGLDMTDINFLKRIYERNIKLDFVKQNLPEGVARANAIDDAIRNWQLGEATKAGFNNLKALNNETRFAKQLMDDLGAEYAGQAGNNAVSLTDWIVLSGGSPTAIAEFLVKKGFSSKTIMAKIAEYLGKGNKPFELKADIAEPKLLNAPAPGAPSSVNNVPLKLPGVTTFEKGVQRSPNAVQATQPIKTINNTASMKPIISEKLNASTLTPEVKTNIVNIIDDYRLNGAKNLTLQQDASAILEDLGVKLPKTYGAVVKKLEDILAKADTKAVIAPKMTVKGFNAANPIDTAPEIVQGHLDKVLNMLKDPDLAVAAQGDFANMIKGLKMDIVDGLKAVGMTKEATAATKVLDGIKTIAQLKKLKVVNGILK